MQTPPLVKYKTVDEYRQHYEKMYCSKPVVTFDGISVIFRKRDFKHAFFKSVHSTDDTFSLKRAQRVNWIKEVLHDSSCDLYKGYIKSKQKYVSSRRVAISYNDYVVIIRLTGRKRAHFVTAFVADDPGRIGGLSTLEKLRQSQKWK